MDRMDWGDVEDFVTLGAVGADQVDESQYYVLIAPQNMVGHTIVKPLIDMVSCFLLFVSFFDFITFYDYALLLFVLVPFCFL